PKNRRFGLRRFSNLRPAGPQGPARTSGKLRVFRGTRTVDSSGALIDDNNQYASFTVPSGVTVTIPSGTVIRCTGTFTNNGTIVVDPGAKGGVVPATESLRGG